MPIIDRRSNEAIKLSESSLRRVVNYTNSKGNVDKIFLDLFKNSLMTRIQSLNAMGDYKSVSSLLTELKIVEQGGVSSYEFQTHDAYSGLLDEEGTAFSAGHISDISDIKNSSSALFDYLHKICPSLDYTQLSEKEVIDLATYARTIEAKRGNFDALALDFADRIIKATEGKDFDYLKPVVDVAKGVRERLDLVPLGMPFILLQDYSLATLAIGALNVYKNILSVDVKRQALDKNGILAKMTDLNESLANPPLSGKELITITALLIYLQETASLESA